MTNFKRPKKKEYISSDEIKNRLDKMKVLDTQNIEEYNVIVLNTPRGQFTVKTKLNKEEWLAKYTKKNKFNKNEKTS